MPAQSKYVLCTCHSCIASSSRTGGKGQRIHNAEYHSHIARPRASPPTVAPPINSLPETTPPEQSSVSPGEEIGQNGASLNPNDLEMDQLSTLIFSTTLQDEGIDPVTHPDKLWTSRHEFQRSKPNPSSDYSLPSIEAITEGIERLSMTPANVVTPVSTPRPTRLNPPSPHSTRNAPSTPSRKSLPSPCPRATPPRAPGLSPQRFTPVSLLSGNGIDRELARREASHHTTGALSALHAAEQKIQKFHTDLNVHSTLSTIHAVETGLRSLESTLLNIKRDVPSVVLKKKDVTSQLSALDHRVRALRREGQFQDPVFISSGTFDFQPSNPLT
jgi:hypothetical protein